MRAWWAGVVVVGLAAGCDGGDGGGEKPPPDPLPTDGPNQVVFYVPGMVCESCPGKVTEGLAMLPWVAPGSVYADRKARQVRFTVTDRAAFDPGAVAEVVAGKGFKGARLLAGPTDAPPAPPVPARGDPS